MGNCFKSRKRNDSSDGKGDTSNSQITYNQKLLNTHYDEFESPKSGEAEKIGITVVKQDNIQENVVLEFNNNPSAPVQIQQNDVLIDFTKPIEEPKATINKEKSPVFHQEVEVLTVNKLIKIEEPKHQEHKVLQAHLEEKQKDNKEQKNSKDVQEIVQETKSQKIPEHNNEKGDNLIKTHENNETIKIESHKEFKSKEISHDSKPIEIHEENKSFDIAPIEIHVEQKIEKKDDGSHQESINIMHEEPYLKSSPIEPIIQEPLNKIEEPIKELEQQIEVPKKKENMIEEQKNQEIVPEQKHEEEIQGSKDEKIEIEQNIEEIVPESKKEEIINFEDVQEINQEHKPKEEISHEPKIEEKTEEIIEVNIHKELIEEQKGEEILETPITHKDLTEVPIFQEIPEEKKTEIKENEQEIIETPIVKQVNEEELVQKNNEFQEIPEEKKIEMKENEQEISETPIVKKVNEEELNVPENKEENKTEITIENEIPIENITQNVVEIQWHHGGNEVLICGDFTNNWKDKITLDRNPSEENVFSTKIKLEPGNYSYKFIVDGKWVWQDDADKKEDGFGGFNNIFVVA